MHFPPRAITGFTLALLGLASLSTPASADPNTLNDANAPNGFHGSYVGVTIDGNNTGDSLRSLVRTTSTLGWIVDQAAAADQNGQRPTREIGDRQFQGRIDVPDVPVSVRGAVVVGDGVRAVLPSLTYDVPVSRGANIYAGAGYALVETPGEQTPLGDRNGVVLNAGGEAAVGRSFVIYGDVRYHPDFSADTRESMRVQIGVGRRF